MKIKHLMIAALAVSFGFTSCTKSNEGGGEDLGQPTSAKIIVTQKSNTRAHQGSANPELTESKITSAKLFVFGPTKILKEIIDLQVAGDGSGASKVVELTTGRHYFYAAINIPADRFSTMVKGTTSTGQFEELIFSLNNISDIATNNSFWMTNLSSPDGNVLVKATSDEATSGAKNKITIEVGRAAAKFGVDFVPNQQLEGTLSGVKYRVRNNPKKMYSVPMFDGSTMKSPFFPDTETKSYFASSDFKIAGVAKTPCTELSYAVENSNEKPKYGNSTYISIQGKFTPTKLYKADGTAEMAINPAGDFWRIAVYSDASKTKLVEYKAKYYAEAPTVTLATNEAVVPYAGGICYYGLWVADNDKTVDYEKYSVHRNTFYWINIVSVNGAGANDEDKVIIDPDEEIDAETWIQAVISIKKWSLIEMNGGI